MRLVVLMLVATATSGCSWLVHDRTNDYLKSEIQPNISVPADVAQIRLTPRLAIPDVKTATLAKEFVVPRPEKLVVDKVSDSVSLTELNKSKLEAELVKDGNGTPILRLNVAFARAWSELGEAIKKSDIHITDLNRSVGTYYIEILDTETVVEVGFWAGLFGGKPDAVKKALQLKVNQARSGVYVAVHIDQENLAKDDDAKSLLNRLKQALQDTAKDNT